MLVKGHVCLCVLLPHFISIISSLTIYSCINAIPFQVSGTEKKVVVVSVSPQSRASLAARYELSSSEAGRRLTAFFKGLG